MIYNAHQKNPGADKYRSFIDLAATVRDTVDALRHYKDEFDCLVVQGVSGMVVGIPASLRLRKPCVVVRKPREDRHGADDFANSRDLRPRGVFLDDFISGGTTFERCRQAFEKNIVNGEPCRIVASFQYSHNTWHYE